MKLKFSFQAPLWLAALLIVATLLAAPCSGWADAGAVTPTVPRMAALVRDKRPIEVVAFGDSITESGRSARWFGGASSAANNWAQVLGVRLRAAYPQSAITVINSGIGGQNAYEGLGRLDELVALKPDVVLVEFGTNDACFHYLAPEETRLALATLAKLARERTGADVVLLGTAGDNPLASFCVHLDATIKATRDAAADAGVPFIDMRMAVLAATGNGASWAQYHLATGNLHPNDAGHKVWADTVFGAISNLLGRAP